MERKVKYRDTRKGQYDYENTKMFCLKLHKTIDADLMNLLMSQDNRQGFLKRLMRDYLEMRDYLKREGKSCKLVLPNNGWDDSVHVVVSEIQLKGYEDGVELHRFNNPAGVPYSAIYQGDREIWSHNREHEDEMIEQWDDYGYDANVKAGRIVCLE